MGSNSRPGKIPTIIIAAASVAAYILIAYLVTYFLSRSGQVPAGTDALYHIHRGNTVYNAVLSGNAWPLLDFSWYNGVETLRSSGPVPAYLLALARAICGADPLQGYLLFTGLTVFLSSIPWLYIGIRRGKPLTGAVMGMVWFFMPHNLLLYFGAGNLSAGLVMIFMPLFVFFCISSTEEYGTSDLTGVTVTFLLMLLCDPAYAFTVFLGTVVFLLINALILRKTKGIGSIMVSVGIAFLADTVMLLPLITGSYLSEYGFEAMEKYFRAFVSSLNPFSNYENTGLVLFGLAAFLLAVFGLLFSRKTSRGAFAAGILQYTAAGPCFILNGLTGWKTLRKPIAAVICALLAVECIPALGLIYGDGSASSPDERFALIEHYALIDRAKEITTQRLALIDTVENDGVDPYLVSDFSVPVNTVFGSHDEDSEIFEKAALLRTAAGDEQYLYLFDRLRELGNDTVILRASAPLTEEKTPLKKIDALAGASGYDLKEVSGDFRLYHLDTGYHNWGTVSDYRAIAIGDGSGRIALKFPAFEEADTAMLDEYTYEDLSDYDVIYLDGFTYENAEYAEALILALSEAGKRIVICADTMPEDPQTHIWGFLGVTCRPISFSNGFPELDTIDGSYFPTLFPRDSADWSTVFLNGLDEVWGKVYDNEKYMPFYGTVKNENIVVIGLNLAYYYSLTGDERTGDLLTRAMDLSANELPKREVVPLGIEYDYHSFTVTSLSDNVNTSFAWHDTFAEDGGLYEKHGMAFVNTGSYTASAGWPYLIPGLIITAAGILLAVFRSRRLYRHS